MPVPNLLVAGVLDEIADRLEIQGANPFRVRAYRSAARTVQQLATDVRQMAERGETRMGDDSILHGVPRDSCAADGMRPIQRSGGP